MTEIGVITALDILEIVWSVLITVIYALATFWYIKLFLRIKQPPYRFSLGFIGITTTLMSLAFLVSGIIFIFHGETVATVATAFVVTVIRPAIFLIGCALIVLAHTISIQLRKQGV